MSIEEQLARDIAAVTGGVVVTESDLRDAREVLDVRIESKRRRDRRRTLAAAAAAAVVIPVLGVAALQTLGGEDETTGVVTPRPPVDSILADGIEGVWRRSGSTDSSQTDIAQLRLGDDGSFAYTETGQLYSSPTWAGEYTLAGDLVTVTLVGGDCAGQQLAMHASLPRPGAMELSYTIDVGSQDCARAVAGTTWSFQRALPMDDPDMRGFGVGGLDDDAPWEPATAALVKPGDWLAAEGGHLLELAPGGTYVVAAGTGVVVDRGEWTVTTGGQLRLTTGSDSPTCEKGDRLVLGQLEYWDPGLSDFIRGRTEQNTCGGAWTPQAWWLMPHANSED